MGEVLDRVGASDIPMLFGASSATFLRRRRSLMKRHADYGSAYFPNNVEQPFWGALGALDLATGKIEWKWKHPSPTWAGIGGLVFAGDAEGNVLALDATTSKALWHFQSGSSAGSALFAFGLL